MVDTEDMDPELARYLNRNYWQQKSDIKSTNVPTTTPSAPAVTTETKATESSGKVVIEVCFFMHLQLKVGYIVLGLSIPHVF